MPAEIQIMIMSGVEDGLLITLFDDRNGYLSESGWSFTVGRRDDNDISLQHDTYVSRQHANLHARADGWHLEDCHSMNGSFVENSSDQFQDVRVITTVPITIGQLFRIGRTWMRLQAAE